MEPGNEREGKIRRYMLLLMVVWSVIVGLSFAFTSDHIYESFINQLEARAKSIHTMDMAYRNWVIGHGGVYVPVTEKTPPSKYLTHVPERDIVTPSGRKLTLLNSSYMTRQVHDLLDEFQAEARGHIASLHPLNPVNRADAWETAALKAFEQGDSVVSGIDEKADGSSAFRLMRPMVIEESCLKCHGDRGYAVGDVHGGVSVSLPLDEYNKTYRNEWIVLIAGHGVIWLLGISGIYANSRRERQALTAAGEREADIRLLTNSIAQAIYGQDEQGRCTFANTICVQLLGYESEAELLGQDMHALMHHSRSDGSGYPPEECPTHWAIREGKRSHVAEDTFWRKDGSSFPVEFWSHPIGLKGPAQGAVVTFMDLTEMKRTQTLLDSVIESMPAMIFLKSADELRFELFNRAGEEILGYRREKLLGKNDYDFFPAEQADAFTENDRSVLESRQPMETPEELVTIADGSQKWLHTYKIGLYDDQGNPTHLLGISMDITARKLAELKLVKSQQELAEAQRVAQIGNWELDLVTNQLHWSDEVFEIFEIDKEKFGASYEAFLETIHPDDRNMVDRAYTRSVEEHIEYEVNHRLLMPDGRIKFVLERGRSFYDEAGKPLRSIGTVQDISRMHEVEEQLMQAQKMEAIGTLVGGIAHDFNNKLAAMTGNLYLVRQSVDADSDIGRRITTIEKLSFEAASMVTQLLTFARKGEVEKVPMMLVPFIKEAAKLNRVAIPENIRLTVDYGEDMLPVSGDVTQLQQVFLNLLTNARDAVGKVDDPAIMVKLYRYQPDKAFYRRHPELEKGGEFGCIQMSDNGCGISEADIEHIFEPFFTTKEVGKGTGLGLATTYGVVQAHRGVIEVASTPGKGATFSVCLPINIERQTIAEQDMQAVVEGKDELILIADDDANVVESFSEILGSLNYRVLVARNGSQAVELYQEHADEIDLVVLDVVMPVLGGVDAAKQIRQIRPDVKLLYATGYDSREQAASDVGADEVLEKPFSIAEVSRKIRQILDRKG